MTAAATVAAMTTNTTTRPADHVAVFGGGGLYGIAYNLGVAEALTRSGHPIARAEHLLGTSAGTWAASAIAGNISFGELADTVEPHLRVAPQLRSGGLARLARLMFAGARDPRVTGIACTLPNLKRIRLHGNRCDLADLIAASSSIPGAVPPHRIGRMLLVDGGVRSNTSVDLAPDADHLTVIVPVGASLFGPIGRHHERQLAGELAAWQQRNPHARVDVHTADAEHTSHVTRPWHLFDPARARDCYTVAYETTLARMNVTAAA